MASGNIASALLSQKASISLFKRQLYSIFIRSSHCCFKTRLQLYFLIHSFSSNLKENIHKVWSSLILFWKYNFLFKKVHVSFETNQRIWLKIINVAFLPLPQNGTFQCAKGIRIHANEGICQRKLKVDMFLQHSPGFSH